MSTSYPEHSLAPVLPGASPKIRKLTMADLTDALRLGWEDFKEVPTHAIMLCAIYPVIGLLIARFILGYSVIPILFPLTAGFALIGQFAALGLYEMSRRRELGEEASASQALEVFRSPAWLSMLGLGLVLLVIFGVWIAVAQSIYVSNFGYQEPSDLLGFLKVVMTSRPGWTLIVLGCGTGAVFALGTLCISVVSFPYMLDRNASMADAVLTSIRVCMHNPAMVLLWGIMIGALLFLGSLPILLGLAVVLPVLGHASWHFYRKAVEPDTTPRELRPIPPKRYAADFPLSLFQWRGGDRRD